MNNYKFMSLMTLYYRKNNNYEKLIVACSIHSYESHEYVSRIDPTVPFNIDLYKEVLKQKVHYSEIENPKVRADIFVGYFNVIVASESIPGISPIDSYNYLLEAEELYNSDEFKKVDSDNEDIKGMMEEIRQGFLVFAGRYNELTDEIKDFIAKDETGVATRAYEYKIYNSDGDVTEALKNEVRNELLNQNSEFEESNETNHKRKRR